MPVSQKIRVMLSSRNSDLIQFEGPDVVLSDVRARMVAELEGVTLFGQPLFEVWTNEDAVESGEMTTRAVCLERVRSADIVIILYNGRAGWSEFDGGVGICHEEFEAAMTTAPQRTYLIELPLQKTNEADERFAEYVATQKRWRKTAKTGEAVLSHMREAVSRAVVDLVHQGAIDKISGIAAVGETLKWNELELQQRREQIMLVTKSFLGSMEHAELRENCVILPFGTTRVACVPSVLPDAFSVGPARESVGQVFRLDDQLLPIDEEVYGPLHIVVCYKGISEASARKLCGVEDLMYLSLDPGLFVRDQRLKMQMLIVAGCRDTAKTRAALQNGFEWIARSGQAEAIARHAMDRASIVRAIQKVNEQVED